MLADNWKLTTATSPADLEAARAALTAKLQRLESIIVGPLFSGTAFSYVDASFAPAFRQLDVLERTIGASLFADLPRIDARRKALAARPSVRDAVPANFEELFLARLRSNGAEILRSAA